MHFKSDAEREAFFRALNSTRISVGRPHIPQPAPEKRGVGLAFALAYAALIIAGAATLAMSFYFDWDRPITTAEVARK